MKRGWLPLIAAAALLGAAAMPRQKEPDAATDKCCTMVEQALEESRRIQPGVSFRKDVEKHFQEEGGLQFPNKGFYSHRACRYIKLEVEYETVRPSAPNKFDVSPEDKVKTVSKLTIGYPTMD